MLSKKYKFPNGINLNYDGVYHKGYFFILVIKKKKKI